MSCFVVDLLKSGVHSFDSEIQKVDYGCQGGQKWRSGADRHTLRKVLCSLKSNQLQLWNPVQKLGLLKKPQSHSLFILVLGWFSFPAKATLLHLGTIFSSTVRPFPASCTWGAIPYHHCTCWTWAQLLGHHQPFLGIWDYKNDKSRLAHRSYLKEHWHISYICPVCFGSSWCEFNRVRSQRWNHEVCNDWSENWRSSVPQDWLFLLFSRDRLAPLLWQPHTSVPSSSAGSFLQVCWVAAGVQAASSA